MKYTVIAKIIYGCVIGAGTLFLCFMHEGIVSAQELFSDKSEEMVIIADISLRDGEVIQDASGNFTLSFTAQNNGALAQPGIRYGVQLYRVSVHDTQQLVLADQQLQNQ